MDLFTVQVVTPEKQFYHGQAKMLEMTTTEGQIGIYKNHIPMTAAAAPGILKIHEENQVLSAALMSGFVEIQPDLVVILAETAEWPDEIDLNRANEAKLRAERRMKENTGDLDTLRAELALKRSLIRLSLAK